MCRKKKLVSRHRRHWPIVCPGFIVDARAGDPPRWTLARPHLPERHFLCCRRLAVVFPGRRPWPQARPRFYRAEPRRTRQNVTTSKFNRFLLTKCRSIVTPLRGPSVGNVYERRFRQRRKTLRVISPSENVSYNVPTAYGFRERARSNGRHHSPLYVQKDYATLSKTSFSGRRTPVRSNTAIRTPCTPRFPKTRSDGRKRRTSANAVK